MKLIVAGALMSYVDVAAFDWYLREIISTNKLASTWLDHVIKESFADRVVVATWLTGTAVIHNPSFDPKFDVHFDITCLQVVENRASFGGSVRKSSDPVLMLSLRCQKR